MFEKILRCYYRRWVPFARGREHESNNTTCGAIYATYRHKILKIVLLSILLALIETIERNWGNPLENEDGPTALAAMLARLARKRVPDVHLNFL